MNDERDYRRINKTELVKLCHQRGHAHFAHLGMFREDLVDILAGHSDPDIEAFGNDPIHLEREGMMEMMDEWDELKRQLTCDYACWSCPPGRVISCGLINCDPDIREMVRNSRR